MKSQSLHQANAKVPDNYKGYKRIFALCLKISTLVTESKSTTIQITMLNFFLKFTNI